jgi:hypothetical protein
LLFELGDVDGHVSSDSVGRIRCAWNGRSGF